MPETGSAARAGRHEPRALALWAVGVAVLTWGFSNVLIKLVSTTGLVASFYRLWFAIPVLWALPALMPSMRRRFDREWLRASLVGGGLFAVHQVLFFSSLKLTTVANVALIGALQPPLVLVVAGWMFGERASRRALAWSLVAVAGTVTVVLGAIGAPGWSPFGDLVALANLFAFTAYFLASKRIRDRAGTTDAFARAILDGEEPPRFSSGRDNLRSLAIVEACVRSAEKDAAWVAMRASSDGGSIMQA